MSVSPYLLSFKQIGSAAEGYICTTQLASELPFAVQRVFWTFGVPEHQTRGKHANRYTQEVLVAVQGSIQVQADQGQDRQQFSLSSPAQGLYIPALCWTELSFSADAIAVCLVSTDYSEADYIRDYSEFLALLQEQKPLPPTAAV